ncbi:MAG: acyl-CoA dehydrogenase family protein [Porticoccaceae bacterium]
MALRTHLNFRFNNDDPDFDPVAIAASLRPLLMAHADQAEREGRIPEPVFRAMRESGLLRMMAPRRAGGYGCNILTHMQTVAELAKGCAGSAWAFGLLSGCTGTAAGMPPAATEILFKTGEELFCSVTSLTATATPCAGGYSVTGQWGYGSGCLHADWAMNSVKVLDGEGQVIDTAFAIIPLTGSDEVRIVDTWHVLGVKGSGSNTIVAEGVFVPDALMMLRSRMPTQAQLLTIPGLEAKERVPQEPLFPLGVLSPTLGAASALLELVTENMKSKAVVGWHYQNQASSEVLVYQLGEAAMEIDSAWLHIRRAASYMDEVAQTRVLTGFDKARIQADCGYAMQQLRRAGERLMDIAGPSGFADGNPLVRFWRDLSFASRHNALNSRLSLELYGRALLGKDSNLMLLADIADQI